MSKTIILFTLGDPAGIGPEVVLKALGHPNLMETITPVCIGNYRATQECLIQTGIPLRLEPLASFDDITTTSNDVVYLLDPTDGSDLHVVRGEPNSVTAECAVESILAACRYLKSHPAVSLITAPISKRAIQASRYRHYKGHAEILQEQFGSVAAEIKNMLIANPFSTYPLRMTHVTSHIPLREVSDFLLSEGGKAKILRTIELTVNGLRKLGINYPRVAVTGLNPHLEEWGAAKERAQLGKEEKESIQPAVKQMQDLGFQVFGPITADSAYRQASLGQFDGVVGMFHDQSHVAANSSPANFTNTIIFTIGTPFLRMSTSHGLATDIAPRFIADSRPIEQCIRMILRLKDAR